MLNLLLNIQQSTLIMNTPHYIVHALFALAGIVSLLASILNWNWFFTARNAQQVVQRVGRRKARLIYGLLGIVFIGMAIFFYIKTKAAMS